jgi:eukaryotic-like serine/threonine-protein kinase
MTRNHEPDEYLQQSEGRPLSLEAQGRGSGQEPDDAVERWMAEWNPGDVDVDVEPNVSAEKPAGNVILQVVVSAVVAALVAAAISYVSVSGALFRRSFDVPNVVGLTMDGARTALGQAELLLVATGESEDAMFPAGQIVQQRPLPGSKLSAGEPVNVLVSRPPVLVKVPRVVGQAVGEARRRLENARLTVGSVAEQAHASLGVGMVISQSVPEGAEVRAGTGLELQVSKGAETVTVPAVVGKYLSKAKDLLTQAGLTPGKIRYTSDDDRSAGLVLGQEPAANKTLGKGSAVDLVVNSD